MDEPAGHRAGADVRDRDAPVFGDEDVVQRDAETAGAAHTQSVPVVEDFGVLGGGGEIAGDLGAVRVLAADAENEPFCVAAGAGEAVAAGDAPAAGRRDADAAGDDAGGGERLLVITPDVELGAFREASDDPLKLGQHAISPGAGGAALGEDLDGLEEEADGGLVAAEATGLEEAEEAGAAEVLDRFAGDVAGGGGRVLAGTQAGMRARARMSEEVGEVMCAAGLEVPALRDAEPREIDDERLFVHQCALSGTRRALWS